MFGGLTPVQVVFIWPPTPTMNSARGHRSFQTVLISHPSLSAVAEGFFCVSVHVFDVHLGTGVYKTPSHKRDLATVHGSSCCLSLTAGMPDCCLRMTVIDSERCL